ncbi:hypothetical protein OROMI_006758 [Orobanche minor]
MASTTEPMNLKKEEEEEDSKPAADDEDTGAQIAPIIKLQEVVVSTGEENEDVLLDLICANHFVLPTMAVQEHHGNEKSCVWHVTDFADGELKEEMFCIRFAWWRVNCKLFKDKIEEITESLTKDSGESEEGAAAANLLNKLSVGEDKEEEKQRPKKHLRPGIVILTFAGVKKGDEVQI